MFCFVLVFRRFKYARRQVCNHCRDENGMYVRLFFFSTFECVRRGAVWFQSVRQVVEQAGTKPHDVF